MVNLGSELEHTTHASNVEASMQVNKIPSGKQPLSARKLEANRRNALRSTDPKTLDGKRHSSRNSLKHGFSARALFHEYVTLNERPEDYNELRRRLRHDYEPVGAAEELEVERIARCWWKLQRAARYEDAEIRFETLKPHWARPMEGPSCPLRIKLHFYICVMCTTI